MKRKFSLGLFSVLSVGSAMAQGLYNVGSEAQESLPLKWVVGGAVTYDDNVVPGSGSEENSFGVNPYTGLSFVNITPQTTWDVYGRLGIIYYLDKPSVVGADDTNSQSRAGVNLTHRFSERLRFSSRNFASYELEPDYSIGVASSRQLSEYLYWNSDNSVGFRWTERVGTYSGLRLTGTDYAKSVASNDRFTWELYNQLRYQLGPQTVLTGDYRYAQTSGNGSSSDSTDQYILAGAEHRFSPNTIGIIRAGTQFRDVDNGTSTASPYMEFSMVSQLNEQLNVRAFTRYGIESYDTVQIHPTAGLVEFDDRRTLRIGISSEYAISPMFSIFGGLDYIPTSYADGRKITGVGAVSDLDEDLLNLSTGVSVKLNDYLTATASYNYTDSVSDIVGREYSRNRISVGLSAEF